MGINLNQNESISQLQSEKDSSNNTKEEIVEQPSIEKNCEKQIELNIPQVTQLSEQTLQTTRNQQQQQPILENSNSSFAYPFPVMRASNISSSSIPTTNNVHSSDEY